MTSNYKAIRHKNIFFTLITILFCIQIQAQSFDYKLDLKPVVIANFPGIHSFAYDQHQGKWLLIGGRLDGLHARQPFNAFPQNKNNQVLVYFRTKLYWLKSGNIQEKILGPILR